MKLEYWYIYFDILQSSAPNNFFLSRIQLIFESKS